MSSGGNFIEDVLNVGLQTFSGGVFGIEDGKLGAGITVKESENALKEITGANAAEDANKQARQQFEQQKSQAEKDRKERSAQFAKEQITASKQAGGARTSGASKSNAASKSQTGGPKTQQKLGAGEQDFLGL